MQSSGRKTLKLNKEAITLPPPVPAPVPAITVQHVPSAKSSFSNFYHSNQQDGFVKKAADYIKKNEGVRNTLYKDSKGYLTIGIGHLVRPEEVNNYKGRVLTDMEIEHIFKKDIQDKIAAIKREFGSAYDMFSDNLKIAILDGYFRGDLPGSPATKKLLKQGNFKQAAKEYLNSNEYRNSLKNKTGIALRMIRNAKAMEAEVKSLKG